MARDDLFRRSFEAGTAFLDLTRDRAEALVKELVKAGDVRKGRAQKLIDDLLERSRKGTEELRQLVRREITDQVAALGLATKDDIGRIESRLDAMAAASSAVAAPPAAGPARLAGDVPPPAEPPPHVSVPTKAPPVKKAGGRQAAGPKAATGRKAPAAAKSPAGTGDTPAGRKSPARKATAAAPRPNSPADSLAPPVSDPPIGDGDAGGPRPEG